MLAPLFALIIPRRHPRQETIVAGLAFSLTALMFATMKTIPAAHAAGIWLLESVFGAPFILRRDSTDLIALVGLAVGWWIWTRSTAPNRHRKPGGWVILSLGALASIATTGPYPDTGIECIVREDEDTILATSYFTNSLFLTRDAGTTWTSRALPSNFRPYEDLDCQSPSGPIWREVDPAHSNIHYRLINGDAIYRSDDAGQTWTKEIDVSVTQAEVAAYEQLDYQYFSEGPLDSFIDEETGRVLVAMGRQGLLIRFEDGEWQWVELGQYKRISMTDFDILNRLLRYEFWAAFMLLFLIAGTLSLTTEPFNFYRGWFVLCIWGVWLAFIISQPAITRWRFEPFYGYGLPVLVVGCALWGAISIMQLYKKLHFWLAREMWLTPLIAALLFFIPYIFWSQGIIRYYTTAWIFALLLAGSTLYAGIRSLRRSLADTNTP